MTTTITEMPRAATPQPPRAPQPPQSCGMSITSPAAWTRRMTAALARCAAKGWQRVVLYGAGTHTRGVAEALADPPVTILALIDDSTERQGRRLFGFPVISRQEVLALHPDAVVLSANSFEETLWERGIIFRENGIPVVRLYDPTEGHARIERQPFDKVRLEALLATEYCDLYRDRVATVRGWLTQEEEVFLYTAARYAVSCLELPILEIGSAWGRSTSILGFGAAASPNSTQPAVFAIDPHFGAEVYLNERHARGESGEYSSYPEFKANLERLGLLPLVRPIVKISSNAVLDVSPGPYGLVWIDGSHKYEDVSFDVRHFAPLVAPGGVLAMHDYNFPDVRRAIEDQLITVPGWSKIATTAGDGNLAYMVRA